MALAPHEGNVTSFSEEMRGEELSITRNLLGMESDPTVVTDLQKKIRQLTGGHVETPRQPIATPQRGFQASADRGEEDGA